MSFFADMLAGGLDGGAQGYQLQLRQDEEERRYKEQQAEKAALALELQKQRSEDLAAQRAMQRDLAEAKMGFSGAGTGTGTSRSGAGGAGNVMERIMFAKTPEEQADAVRYVEATGGRDAAAQLATRYGRPMQEQVEEFDPEAAAKMDNRAYAEANPETPMTKKVTRDANYDRDAGATALNRVIAMADPAKFDDYIKGERGAMLNTNATKVEKGVMPREQAEATQSLSNPTADPNKVDATIQNAQTRADTQLAAKKIGTSGGAKTGTANNIFKTITDESGNVFGIRRDGTQVDLKIKSDSFNKQVSALVTKMNESEGGGFRKLSESEKRARATERLVGTRQEAAPALPASRASQFRVIR